MPFRQLFTRRNMQVFTNQSKEMLMERTANFWRQNQFYITFPGQYQMHGEQVFSKIGLRRVVDVWVFDHGANTAVDLSFSATLGDAEAAVGVIGAVLLLPVTAVVGAVSYLDYTSDADQLIASYWSYMGVPRAQPMTSPEQIRQCQSCGTTLDPDAKFCKNCGGRVEPPAPP